MTPYLCEAARTALNWKQLELAKMACISRATLVAYEAERANLNPASTAGLQRAFWDSGIEFTGGEDPVGFRIFDMEKFVAARSPKPKKGDVPDNSGEGPSSVDGDD